MSLIRDRLTPEAIRAAYTHYGTLHGVPIYCNPETGDVRERNGTPSWWLTFVLAVNQFVNTGAALLNPRYEATWPIRIDGPIA